MKHLLLFITLGLFVLSHPLIANDSVGAMEAGLSGCTDPAACNFDPAADIDDGSCQYDFNAAIFNIWSVAYEATCDDPENYPAFMSPDIVGNVVVEFLADGTFFIDGVESGTYEACGNDVLVTETDGTETSAFIDETTGSLFVNQFFGCTVMVPFVGCNDENANNYHPIVSSANNDLCIYTDACGVVSTANGQGYGFFNYYDPSNWDLLSEGDGSVFFTPDNQSIAITGSNTDTDLIDPLTQVTIIADQSGAYSFDWVYTTDDESPEYDVAYYINGERIDLVEFEDEFGNPLPPDSQWGSVSFDVTEGDVIGFGIDATDDCCGEAELIITNFTYPHSCIVGCTNPTADNYTPIVDVADYSLCVWTNPCGDIVGSDLAGGGFIGDFATENWTIVEEGTGSVDADFNFVNFFGSDEDAGGFNVTVSIAIEAPATGTYGFMWYYETQDDEPSLDPAFYSINDEMFILTPDPELTQEGLVTFDLEAGDVLTIGTYAFDDCCGASFFQIANFIWPVNCVGGCLDETAINFSPEADYDNGQCVFLNDCEVEVTAGGAHVNFTDAYAPASWAINSEGDGSVSHSEDQLFITGSDGGGDGDAVLTEVTIVADRTGSFSFDWFYSTNDGAEYDVAYMLHNGRVDLTVFEDEFGNNYENAAQYGSVVIEVVEGDVIGFGVEAVDDCCDPGNLEITYFGYPADECVPGCTNADACNFDPLATFDDGSCDYACYGCTDPDACNYDDTATLDDGSCEFESCLGCTDPIACNYDETATVDDGSCTYLELFEIVGDTETVTGATNTYTYEGGAESTFEWTVEGGDIVSGQGSNTVEITWNDSGVGTVSVIETSVDGCVGEEVSISIDVVTNIEEGDLSAIRVYPNPASEHLTIEGVSNDAVLTLFDAQGRIVQQVTSVNAQHQITLSMSGLSTGHYILQIFDQKIVVNERIVIAAR